LFISSVRNAASPMRGPANTSFAPVIGTLYGKPHAFAWNIGTIASTESPAERFIESTMQPA
jgi:hypothetical protein